jgi:hypothetical protein
MVSGVRPQEDGTVVGDYASCFASSATIGRNLVFLRGLSENSFASLINLPELATCASRTEIAQSLDKHPSCHSARGRRFSVAKQRNFSDFSDTSAAAIPEYFDEGARDPNLDARLNRV